MRFFALVLVVLFSSNYSFSAILFQDNFNDCTSGCNVGTVEPDSANWLQWHRDQLSANKDGVTKYSGEITSPGREGSGGKSLKLWRHGTSFVGSSSYSGALVMSSPGSYSDFYMRFYAKMPSSFDMYGGVGLKMFRFNTSGGEIYLNINPTGDGWYRGASELQIYGNNGWKTLLTSNKLLSLWDGNWHCWQFRFNLTTNTITMWIDGVQAAAISDPSWSGAWNSYIQHFPLGNQQASYWQNSWQAFEVDDLVFATTKAETDPISSAPGSGSDATPPVRSSGTPSGALAAGTTQATMSLVTDENATCRYSSSAGTAYASMGGTFSTSGAVAHSVSVTGLTDGGSYSRFVKCIDASGNANTDDYIITWNVTATTSTPPSTPPANVLFEETFESTNLSSAGWYDNTSPSFTTSGTPAGSARALQFAFSSGATNPVNGGAMRKKFTASDSVYIRYYVKYSTNWVGSQQTYHPHEFYLLTNKSSDWSGLAYTPMTAYVEQNALRPRIGIQDSQNINTSNINGNLVNVTENRAIAGCNGDSDGYGNGACYLSGSYYNGKEWNAPGTTLSKGVWHKVEAYLKLNSVANNKGVADGVIQYWLNDQLVMNHSNVMFRTAQNADMKFNQFVIAPWIGDGSPVAQTFWVDNLIVATAPPAGGVTAPAPAGLQISTN